MISYLRVVRICMERWHHHFSFSKAKLLAPYIDTIASTTMDDYSMDYDQLNWRDLIETADASYDKDEVRIGMLLFLL